MEVFKQSVFPNLVPLFLLILSLATVTDGQVDACNPNPCQNGGQCVQEGELGGYSCLCINQYFIGQNCTSLTFTASIGIHDIMTRQLLPFVASVTPADLTKFNSSKLNDTIVIVPSALVNNPTNAYRWTLNTKTLDPTQNNNVIISNANGILTIPTGTLADAGQYQFFISNEFGAMFSNKVGLEFSTTGNYISPNTPINVSMTENEPYLIPCPARSYRNIVTYMWQAFVNNQQQSIDNNANFSPRILMEPNGDLLFSYVDGSDFTTFMVGFNQSLNPLRCRTTDRFGNSVLGPPIYFTVMKPASQSQSSVKFYTKPAGLYTLATGDQFYLNCTAGGRPVPDILWYKNNALIANQPDLFEFENYNRTLRLGLLSSAKHDGDYKCVADNGLNRKETSFTVKVIDKVTPLYSKEHQGFEIMEIKSAKHGGSVTLPCNTTGGDIISRKWHYNGVGLQYISKFANRWSAAASTGALTITDLQLKDFGLFQCVVKNKVSEDYMVSLLVVTGAPLPPYSVSLTDCANYTTNITWSIFLSPELLPPSGFIIEVATKALSRSSSKISSYYKLAEVSDGLARSYLAENLKANNEFFLRIRSKNQVGVGFPSYTQASCITNSRQPSLYPKKLSGFGLNSDGVLNISWKALDAVDWAGPGCRYRLFFRENVTNATWTNSTVINDCARSSLVLSRPLANTVYEVKIGAENNEGSGPISPSVFVRSGQRPPFEPPVDLTVLRVDSSSVELQWAGYDVQPPNTVDGYWIYAWIGPRNYEQRFEFEEIPRFVLVIPPDAIRVHIDARGVTRGVVKGLEPWTQYTIAVQGYNSGGLGPYSDEDLIVTTLDSKNSYYILSLRIISENFTEDLKDKSSNKFKILKENVTREVSKLYEKEPWFNNAEVLYFSSGSVQAEVQLEVASPNMSVVYQVVSSMDNVGNFSVDRNATRIRTELALQSVMLSASQLLVNVSDSFVINCTVIGGPDDLNITWSKAGKVIGLSHRTKVETGLRHSRLTVRDVMAEDEGNYVCQAVKGIQNGTATAFVEVVPVLEIKPRAVTKRVGDEVTFACDVVSGFRQGASVVIIEVTSEGNEIRYQEMNFTATNLQIPEGGESHVRKFVCEMSLQQKVLSRSEVAELIIIQPDAPKCPEELLDGVLWSATAAGGTDIKPCPKGASGTASRNCSEEVKWKDGNFVGCSSRIYVNLGDEIEAITEGFESNTTARQVLSQLANATQTVPEIDTKRPPEIFGGDLVIAVNVLVTLADYNSKKGNVSTEEDTENFAQVASNLLDSTNQITWLELEKLNQGQGRSLVKAMDAYGLGVANTWITGSADSRTVETKNLVMRIDRANNNSPLRDDGLFVAYNESSIYLPPDAFNSPQDSRVITLVYLTLNDVLPLGQKSKDDKADDENKLSPNTTIVSSTIVPRPPAVLKNPVKIVLQNRRVDVPSGVTPEGKCVFWRPGETPIWQTSGCRLEPSESDISKTTCICDHLTIFASLMDPYGAPIGEADKKALEIISIVGCSISLLAVIITMVVTVFFWRAVKSPRAKVLLNLCAAVAVSCILVISEGSARDDKVGCSIVAALLHYFLLALFCWMLCEGALLYILLVKVFGGGAEDKVKYFYMFGWGFPVIIVAISLAATQADGYGSPDACWLDVRSGLIWAFIAPAIVIILINIVVFILVIRQMMGTRHVQNKTQVEKVRAGVKASAVILPLLGITWVFGLLSFSSSTVVFKYIFAIANSLQGLMIFIFHCLLNKQIKDAIKRRQEKSSSGAVQSTTPKTKPSPIQNAKHATNLPGKAPGNKKRSNRAQNDYEMVDSIVSEKNGSTLPSSTDNKNAVINIPDDEHSEQLPETKVLPRAEENDHESLTFSSCPVSPDQEDFEEDKTSMNSFIHHKEQGNGLTREGAAEGSKRGEDLPLDHPRGSIDGVTNHIYEKPLDDHVPSFEKFQRDGHHLRPEDEDEDTEVKSDEERTPGNSPEGCRRGGELVHDKRVSLEGFPNRMYENTPDEFDPSFVEIRGRDEARLHLEERRSSSSSSSSDDSDVESVEISMRSDPAANQEEVICVIEGAPVEGASPIKSDDPTSVCQTAKKVEPREFDDTVKNDEDFEIKMTERRKKVDSLQRAAEGFKTHKLTIQTTSSHGMWEQVRRKIHRGSYKLTTSGGESGNQDDVPKYTNELDLV